MVDDTPKWRFFDVIGGVIELNIQLRSRRKEL